MSWARSSLDKRSRRPEPVPVCRTHLQTVCVVQSNLAAIEITACHCEE